MSELSEQEKGTLMNAVRLIYAKGLNSKAECIVAVNFDDLAQKLLTPQTAAPDEKPKEKK